MTTGSIVLIATATLTLPSARKFPGIRTALQYLPIGFGVLTTENRIQAEERADPERGDKGYEAAIAAATLLNIPPVDSESSIGFRR